MARAGAEQPRTRGIRCAIYTRKSTEEGLDQAFNSLDAQREACSAFIASQRHEGWLPMKDEYDDGGYSGGSMERPGLKRLLADVAVGKVDVIVVYKVDRLTRSLADFAKIVEILDARQVSFVSVTQAFNTTTSMGRLTLNVLLSFAQFEREVTGERIRDKVAASKRKGMWMGGNVPLGYDVVERKLVPNEQEASIVRLIYERYLALGSMTALSEDLRDRDVRSKRRVFADGRVVGDIPFRVGALSHLIRNPVYIGEVRHNAERYPGEHPAIVELTVWDAAQALLEANGSDIRSGTKHRHASLLAGRIRDGEGRDMTPSHSCRGSRRYRYYVTRSTTGQKIEDQWRVPAGDIEPIVIKRLGAWLAEPANLINLLGPNAGVNPQRLCLDAARLGRSIDSVARAELRRLLGQLEVEVSLSQSRIEISFAVAKLLDQLSQPADDHHQRVTIFADVTLCRRGQELRMVLPVYHRDAPARTDTKLIELLVKARQAHALLVEQGQAIDPSQRSHLTRIARLNFLAPDIVVSILEGRQPASLTARQLLRAANIPMAWQAQREMFGFN